VRCTTSAYAVRCRAASMFCTIRDKLTAFSLMNPSARRFAWWDCCRKALTATAHRSPACCIRSTGSPTIRQVYLSHGPAGQRRDPVLPGADVRSRSFHAADLHADGGPSLSGVRPHLAPRSVPGSSDQTTRQPPDGKTYSDSQNRIDVVSVECTVSCTACR